MAYLLRLALAAFVWAFASSACASIPLVPTYRLSVDSGTAAYYTRQEAADAACPKYLPAATATDTYKCGPIGQNAQGVWYVQQMRCQKSNGQCFGGDTWTIVQNSATSCPANSTKSGSACQCATGYVELSGTSCVVDNGCMTLLGMTPPNSGACVGGNCQYGYKVAAGEAATAQPFGRFCNAGCTVKGELDFCGQYSSGVMIAGQGVCQVSKSYYTGDKCTGSGAVTGPSSQGTQGGTTTNPSNTPTVEANPMPQRVPEGKCPGQVNGVDVLVNCGSVAERDTSTSNGTTVKADGTTVNNTTNNTTTTSTVCNGNSCTTTTTVTSGGSGPNGTGTGSSTSTTQETGTKADMCAKNPSAAACKGDDDKPNGFGGSCAGGFKAVSEDAVINAMAEETYRQNCKVNPDDASQTLGREEAAKTGNQTGNNPNNGNVSIGAGSFDSSNALGGVASCIADKTIVVMGRSINIAFSMICQYLEALGLVMLGVASLLALRIVTRG